MSQVKMFYSQVNISGKSVTESQVKVKNSQVNVSGKIINILRLNYEKVSGNHKRYKKNCYLRKLPEKYYLTS